MIKNALVSTKNFVSKNKVAIAVAVTAVACLAIHRGAVKDWNKFLEEKGLMDEFYTLED